MTLTGNAENGVTITPFRKPTARNPVLLATSCHPPHVVHNIPLGKLIRMRRNSTWDSMYYTHSEPEEDPFKKNTLSPWTIERAKKQMASVDRSRLISGSRCNIGSHSNSTDRSITFCTTYSSQFLQIVRIIKHYLLLLCTHDQLHDIMGSGVRFISKKAPTLGTMISPSLYINLTGTSQTWLTMKGFFSCGYKVCSACKFAKPNSHFSSFANNKNFPVKGYINCNTKHTVYLLSCSLCKVQYVGCTTGPFF